MMKNKYYTGIDCFRLIAALLVVAIHTSPLAAFSATCDFVLTRIIARVAVPFFFMTSGFFLISHYARNTDKLAAFVKRTAVIYGLAMLIYIPVNIYSGYFDRDALVPNIIKDVVFDGTFYHLWYFPASIIGAGIAWYFVRTFDYGRALGATAILYLIGLFGDSWYGVILKAPALTGVYDCIFQVCDYTRNGIFFAPVFFVLGGLAADSQNGISAGKCICGFGASFALMFVEALALHRFNLQHHDSMYLFLLPCSYFLFHAILHFSRCPALQGKGRKGLRAVSLTMYVIHPFMIVAVRFLAKLLHLQKLLIENSVVHYVAVSLTSAAFGVIIALWRDHSRKNIGCDIRKGRAYLEIDLENLEHNARVLEQAMPQGCRLMAVVKANGYGHGAFEISTQLNRIGVKAFAAATIDEGIMLRKYGVRGDILILGYTSVCRAAELKKYDLTQTLIDYDYAAALNGQKIRVKAHIKVDTGMHRLGVDSGGISKIKMIFDMKNIRVCGIYTHLCCSDSLKPDDAAYTEAQIGRFYSLLDALKRDGVPVPKVHIQSSFGLLNYPNLTCDYVRAGIALYGVFSSPRDDAALKLDLRPVLSLKTKVVLIRSVRRGECAMYGRSFLAERDSLIAILPVGYGDGFPRSLSHGKGRVCINGQYAPTAGLICMDQMAVDITGLENVSVGDTAILIGADGTEGFGVLGSGLSAPEVSDCFGSISNELLCRMGGRLPVITK